MRRATAKDVAQLAGCSVTAVSLVMNARTNGHVSEALRERILSAVEELGYLPNGGARDLATQTQSNVAFICPDITNPFSAEVFSGVIQALRGRYGVALRVQSHGEDYGPETVAEVQVDNLGGLILVSPAPPVLAQLRPTSPTVLIDAPSSSTGLTRVDLDLVSASTQIASHLTSLGHERIAYLDLALRKPTFDARRDALDAALSDRGARLVGVEGCESMTIDAATERFSGAWERWRRLGVTAIACADDILAYGVVAAAKAMRLRIPADFSLISFNDIPYSRLIDPPLTSVAFGAHSLGEVAGAKLLQLIDSGVASSASVPTILQHRGSTSGIAAS